MAEKDLFGNPVPTSSAAPKRSAPSRRPARQFGRPRRHSRADLILPRGQTPKRLAANTRRSLNSARATLERLAVPWEDVDNTVQWELQPLLAAFDEFEKSINSSVEWLLEDAPYS